MNDKLALLTSFDKDPILGQLEQELQKFNIFEAIGMTTQEIRHSHFLAFLLDPNQNHGLGNQFLLAVLKHIGIDTSQLSSNFKTTIEPEWTREGRRIDILIRIDNITSKLVVAIENKVHSDEGEDQLRRYREVVINEYQGFQHGFIYLTPDARKPSNDEDQQYWISLSYAEIAQWVDNLCSSIGLGAEQKASEIKTLLKHYTSMLRRHIVSDSDIAKLAREIYFKHKVAINTINEFAPTVQQELGKYITDLLAQSTENGPNLKVIYSARTGKRVDFVSATWETTPFLQNGMKPEESSWLPRFRFYSDTKELGLYLHVIQEKDIGEMRTRIFEKLIASKDSLNPNFGFQVGKLPLTKNWTTIFYWRILTEENFMELSADEMKKKIKDFWNQFALAEDSDLGKICQIIEAAAS